MQKDVGKYGRSGRASATATRAPANADKSHAPGDTLVFARQQQTKGPNVLACKLDDSEYNPITSSYYIDLLSTFAYRRILALSFRGHSWRLRRVPTKQDPT